MDIEKAVDVLMAETDGWDAVSDDDIDEFVNGTADDFDVAAALENCDSDS